MELRDAIYKRQSIRKYTDADVPHEDMLKIIDAGRIAPSGDNSQNWYFLVIRDRALRDKIGETVMAKNEEIALVMDKKDPAKGLRFRKFAKNFMLFAMEAPVLVVVYATNNYPSGYYEYVFAEYPQSEIDKLFVRNPGMQNIGAALENMTLTAIDLGYGSCLMTSQNYAAEELQALLKNEIGFEKEGYFLTTMMPIGVPQEGARSPSKKSLEEICTFV